MTLWESRRQNMRHWKISSLQTVPGGNVSICLRITGWDMDHKIWGENKETKHILEQRHGFELHRLPYLGIVDHLDWPWLQWTLGNLMKDLREDEHSGELWITVRWSTDISCLYKTNICYEASSKLTHQVVIFKHAVMQIKFRQSQSHQDKLYIWCILAVSWLEKQKLKPTCQ